MNWLKFGLGLFIVIGNIVIFLVHSATAKEPTAKGGCLMSWCVVAFLFGAYLMFTSG